MLNIEVYTLLVRVNPDLDCIVDRPTKLFQVYTVSFAMHVNGEISKRMFVIPFHGDQDVE